MIEVSGLRQRFKLMIQVSGSIEKVGEEEL